MKKQRTLRVMFILCFCAMLALPLAFADFTGGKDSTVENRVLAEAPTLQNGLNAFHHGVEPWLNDNIGFRDAASRIVTKLDYALFRRSAKSNNMIGKEDWIYYYNDDILADFIGGNAFTPEQTDAIANDMRRITERLAARGCETLFVLVPDKKSVYPEYYPAGIHRVAESSRLTQLGERLTERGLNVLDLQPALEKGKELGFVYSQRLDDAHWNALGAYVGYQAIVEQLQAAGARRLDKWTITPYEAQGSFNASVPLSETNYIVKSGAEADIQDAASELASMLQLLYNNDAATYQRRYRNTDARLPKLLFVGDSYMQSSYPYYPQSFSETTYLHFSDAACFWRVFEQFTPDVVVFESAERMLDFWQDVLAKCAKEQ